MAVVLSNPVFGTLLSAAAVNYYTAENVKTKILNATVCNTTGTARLLTVHLVPPGGAVAAANMVESAKSISPGETYNCPELVGKNLLEGWSLWAFSDVANALNLLVSGLSTTGA